MLVRHKPQWHRHDRRDSTVVPSLIVVAPRKTVKTADLRGGTATFNMFRGASAVLVPSHRGRGATAVLVRHKPHWHRHDRRGSASDRRSTAENGQHCRPSRGHGGNFEHVQKLPQATAGWANPHWDRRGTAMTAVAPPGTDMTAVVPYKNRSSTSITAVSPSTTAVQSRKRRMATLRRSRGGSTAVNV